MIALKGIVLEGSLQISKKCGIKPTEIGYGLSSKPSH